VKKLKLVVMLAVMFIATMGMSIYMQGCSKETGTPNLPERITGPANTDEGNVNVPGDTSTVDPKGGMGLAAAAAINWNTLNTVSKRQLILETAYRENGWDTDYNCKTWSQHIVTKASNGVTSLPPTCPISTGYYFCSGRVTLILQNQSASYTYFLPGRVLQMWYGGVNKPHTAFIFSTSPSGMEWIDCNFIGGVGNGIIGIHYISWSDFYKKVPAYTLYEVY